MNHIASISETSQDKPFTVSLKLWFNNEF